MFRKIKHVHFVGIGGIGMSGIAEVLLNMGYQISGSDLKRSSITERLHELGAVIGYGHAPGNLSGADVVVYSSAVREDNLEVREAMQQKIPVIPRAEMLAELMRMKYSIAIAGTHGKTTTTSLIGTILSQTGLDPTLVIGGRLNILGSSARLGKGDILVAEADESDRSFLMLTPTIAVVTNIDEEHMEHYRDLDDLKDTFAEFLNKIPFYGTGIVCLDEPHIQAIIPRLKRSVITYGFSRQADLIGSRVKICGFDTRFTVTCRGDELGEITLKIPGRHNVLNGLAAIAVSIDLGIDFSVIQKSLNEYQGAERRCQLKGDVGGVMILDDYGHHPTEIRLTLSAIKEGWKRRIIAIFQPHRYSRVRFLMDEFSTSFYEADAVVVTDIYPAGETPIPEVTAETVTASIKNHGHKDVVLIKTFDEIVDYLAKKIRPDDIVVTLGAGTVYQVAEKLVQRLKEKNTGKS